MTTGPGDADAGRRAGTVSKIQTVTTDPTIRVSQNSRRTTSWSASTATTTTARPSSRRPYGESGCGPALSMTPMSAPSPFLARTRAPVAHSRLTSSPVFSRIRKWCRHLEAGTGSAHQPSTSVTALGHESGRKPWVLSRASAMRSMPNPTHALCATAPSVVERPNVSPK